MKRLIPVMALAAVLVMVFPAWAKSGKKALMSDNFQAGFDLGAYFFGAIPYSKVEINKGDVDEKASIAGAGGFGFPIIGAHFNMLAAEKYIIHLDVGYAYQTGTAKYKFDNKDIETKQFDFSMQTIRGSVGVGQGFLNTARVNPYWMLGLSVEQMIMDDQRGHTSTHDKAVGTGVGPWGALGVDVKIVHTKGLTFFAGGQFRLDIMYTVIPLARAEPDDTTVTLAWVPLSMILTGGIGF